MKVPAFISKPMAFPFRFEHENGASFECAGMTLRDYFAAAAVSGIAAAYVQGNGSCVGTDHFPRNVAAHAYRLADAMIEARSRE